MNAQEKITLGQMLRDDYLKDSHRRLEAELDAVNALSRAERKTAYTELCDDLKLDREHFLTSCKWLLTGTYGRGALLSMERLSGEANRNAHLFNLVSNLEYRTGDYYARKAWKFLDKKAQDEINGMLTKIIDDWDQLYGKGE